MGTHMRKNFIIINGAPGVGKTTTWEELAKTLPKNVYLDCDCFMWANPYVATEIHFISYILQGLGLNI